MTVVMKVNNYFRLDSIFLHRHGRRKHLNINKKFKIKCIMEMEDGSKDDTEVFPLNDYDYLHQIQDEICLEGLDGITLQSLWLRLSNRPRYTLG